MNYSNKFFGFSNKTLRNNTRRKSSMYVSGGINTKSGNRKKTLYSTDLNRYSVSIYSGIIGFKALDRLSRISKLPYKSMSKVELLRVHKHFTNYKWSK